MLGDSYLNHDNPLSCGRNVAIGHRLMAAATVSPTDRQRVTRSGGAMQRRSFLNPASLQSEMGLVPDTGARRCRALSAGHASQVIRRRRHAAPWRDRRCVGPDGRERGECDVQHGVDRRAGPSAAMLVADRALERYGVVARDQHRVTKFRRGEATVLSRTPSIAWAIGRDWLRSMTPQEPDPRWNGDANCSYLGALRRFNDARHHLVRFATRRVRPTSKRD